MGCRIVVFSVFPRASRPTVLFRIPHQKPMSNQMFMTGVLFIESLSRGCHDQDHIGGCVPSKPKFPVFLIRGVAHRGRKAQKHDRECPWKYAAMSVVPQ